MDRRIKFRHLEAFVAIARAKRLKRAAEQLNLTQPAISKTLKDLEGILGVSLMDRGRAGIRLTHEGDVFLRFAEQSLSALSNGLSSISAAKTDGQSLLTVGALPSVMGRLLPRAANLFRTQMPQTVLQVFAGPHDAMTDQLRAGSLDLCVGRMGSPASMSALSFTQLYSESVVIVVAPDHPLKDATRLEQLIGFPVIYPPQSAAIRPLVARKMIATGLPLFADRIESTSESFGRAVTLGPMQALWFISKGVVEHDLDTGNLRALDIDMSETAGPVGIMARSEEPPSTATQLFRRCLLESAQG
ncbi:pca operon transcription factor PcaQ [Planktotalea sp.]|uniref:pca operon transcription factor PcaQ n=1 Tax=Planktotalea sp. TaxID=2029877 RepID=UPI003D6ADF01